MNTCYGYERIPMCANFRPSSRSDIRLRYGVDVRGDYSEEAWPGRMAPMIRRNPENEETTGEVGYFGLLPFFAGDTAYCRSTYNARTETVAQKPSFKQAWLKGQFCLVPASKIYEPCYESGAAVRWSIEAADGQDLCVGGLWSRWVNPATLEPELSFTMLTLNADNHPLMRRFHKPDDEKRMVFLLQPDDYEAWLTASPELARAMIKQYPAELLHACAAPMPPRKKKSERQLFADDNE